MIALEVSSAAGPPPYGGIDGSIRNRVPALLALDPDTPYTLCYRFSRWRRGDLFRPDAPNVRVRLIVDPLNDLLLRGVRLFHSMGIYMPRTPRVTRLLSIHDLNAVRNLDWVRPEWHRRRTARIREALARADHVVTYSAFTKGEVCEEFGLPEERVHPVLLGIDPEAFAPPAPAEIERARARYGDYVVSIGILTARKNFPALVDAVAPLGPLRLVLVARPGDDETAVREAIARHRLEERVELPADLSHAELVALLAGARAAVVPSLYEGFGLTVLEAMAAGAPVVCSTAASLPEVAGDAALMVDARDVEALRDAIGRVTGDSALAADLRERGFKRVREMSWESSARALRDLYHRLLP